MRLRNPCGIRVRREPAEGAGDWGVRVKPGAKRLASPSLGFNTFCIDLFNRVGVDLQQEKGSCRVAECGSRASRVAAVFGVRAGRPGMPGGRRDSRPTQRQFFAPGRDQSLL